VENNAERVTAAITKAVEVASTDSTQHNVCVSFNSSTKLFSVYTMNSDHALAQSMLEEAMSYLLAANPESPIPRVLN
jgi:hypothetical protein